MKHPHFDHTLPLWVDPNATFFVTTCAQARGQNHFCKQSVADDAIGAARKYHEAQRWFCSLIVLMPDHVHMLVTMAPEHDLSKTGWSLEAVVVEETRCRMAAEFLRSSVARRREFGGEVAVCL